MMSQSVERDISFTPDMAGKRVGWVSVSETNDCAPGEVSPLSVNVVSATVGPDGAWFGHLAPDYGDVEAKGLIAKQEGFMAISAISAILQTPNISKWEDEFNFTYLSQNTRDGNQLLDKGVDSDLYKEVDSPVDWAKSPKELIDLLKEKLNDAGFKERYAQLYYWLNGTVARVPETFDGVSVDELLLPDQRMRKTTREQLVITQKIVDLLTISERSDSLMRKRLTVFSDIPAAKIPNVFVENRRNVSNAENGIMGYVSKLAVRQIVHIPIGAQPGGRIRPYMDATDTDEIRSFGRELAGLRRNQVEPANGELTKEQHELIRRRKFAQAGLERFGRILHAEVL